MKKILVVCLLTSSISFSSAKGSNSFDDIGAIDSCDSLIDEGWRLDYVLGGPPELYSEGQKAIEHLFRQHPEFLNCHAIAWHKRTPLTAALSSSGGPRLNLARFLIIHGADVNLKDDCFDLTPLHYALQAYEWVSGRGKIFLGTRKLIHKSDLDEIVDLLIANGAKPAVTSKYGVSVEDFLKSYQVDGANRRW